MSPVASALQLGQQAGFTASLTSVSGMAFIFDDKTLGLAASGQFTECACPDNHHGPSQPCDELLLQRLKEKLTLGIPETLL